ncbi:MAG: ABC transporter permease [Helicobacteraceae bacterium]|jgi:putative ABC transport system permease protein|nr:ABC transporter permease [Helicobacteraceae bacterium]
MRALYLLSLAQKSAWSRRGTLALVTLSIALSTALLLGVERIRSQVKESFVQTISGTDLIVGARGGDIQLMLYAVFHLGSATNNMSYKSAQAIDAMSETAWTIPISLGDSHKGYPVVATTKEFFDRYKFRVDRRADFALGRPFDGIFEVVLGAKVANNLKLGVDSTIVLSHGSGSGRLLDHGDKPFTVVGVLAPTGTTLDRSLFISLEAMEAIHIDWQGGAPIAGLRIAAEHVTKFNLEPKSITALLVGLKKRSGVFAFQRAINEYQGEPLLGVMPGVAMDRLWQTIGIGEKALLFVSLLVTVTGLFGLASAILAGLGERRRELAVLRSAGAKAADIVVLLLFESVLLVTIGAALGAAALAVSIWIFAPMLESNYGIALYLSPPSVLEWALLGAITLAGLITGLIPAIRAYRISLADGLRV